MSKASRKERVAQLESRNSRVEADKGWETSWTRRISIAVLTYAVVATYLATVIGIDPWLNALVPVAGFLLSTLTLSYLKTLWVSRRS